MSVSIASRLSVLFLFTPFLLSAQNGSLSGTIRSGDKPVSAATVRIRETGQAAIANEVGFFMVKNIRQGLYNLTITCVGFEDYVQPVSIKDSETLLLTIYLTQDEMKLNNVVVTGVSKATLIRKNPVAIVGVTAKQLAQTSESNLIDALAKNVPGLNIVKTGPNISKPFIRGLGYNRVLTLYDEIKQEGQQWGDEHGIEVDAYNVIRAEVIKGPASLQYGSDAIAGVVSLFSYLPDNTNGKIKGSFISEYQTNNNLVGNGLRFGNYNKHFLWSASGSVRFANNYRNTIDKRVYNTNFSEKNISLLAGIKNNSGYSHINLTLYDNLQGIPDGSRDSLTRAFTRQIAEGSEDDVKNRPVVSENKLNTYRLSPLHQHIQHYRIYTHHSYRMGNGEIDALIGFQQNIRREYNHPTAPTQAGMYVRLNTLNYSLRYNAPEWSNIELTAGMNGMIQNNKSLAATDFPIPDYHLFDIGMYLYGKRKCNRWTVSGGFRYDVRYISWDDFYTKTNMATGFGQHVKASDTSDAYLQFAAYRKVLDGASASLGFTFQADSRISLKANIGQGYRAPSVTEIASNGLDPGAHIIYLGNKQFVPEFSLQEDIGISAVYQNFSGDVSFFNNNIRYYIYLTMLADANGNAIVDAQGNKTFQYQQSAAQLYGFETWFSYHPQKLKGFSFDNNIATVYGFNRKESNHNKGTNGEYLPLIPPLKMMSSVVQKIETEGGRFTSATPKIEAEYNTKQNRFLGLNGSETSTPGYLLMNAGIASEIRYIKKTVQVQLQVNNLFNKTYQSHLSRLKYFEYYSQSTNGRTGMYNMGRNICVKMLLPL